MQKPILLIVATLLFAGGAAQAESVDADKDTFVRANNKGPYGDRPDVQVTHSNKNKHIRKGLVSFTGVRTNNVLEASLSLDVSRFESDSKATFLVYGVRDFWAGVLDDTFGCEENFDEDIKYNHLPYLNGSNDGVRNNSGCIFEGKKLGKFTVKRHQLYDTVTFSSQAMVRFMKENHSSRVTFLLVRAAADKKDGKVGFASREHDWLNPARFEWTPAEDLGFPDWAEGAEVENDGRTVHYRGTLEIPVANGQVVTVPAADVTLTYLSTGKLWSITGTVGYPELPEQGLFQTFGDFGGSGHGPALQIGYATPFHFNESAELPLVTGSSYFYFRTLSGASLTWGPVEAASPDAGETLLVLDQSAPAFLFYTEHLPGAVPLDSLRMGVSAQNTIPFSPAVDAGVGAYMTSFQGDLYLGAAGSLPTQIPGLYVTVDGELTADVDDSAFPHGQWVRYLGGNGSLGLDATVGVFTVSMPVSESSSLYRASGESGDPSFAFSGKTYAPDLGPVPLTFDGTSRVAGYLTAHNNGAPSFVDITGRLGLFPKHKIDATVHLGGTDGNLSGQAKFGGATMAVDGEVTNNAVNFSGKLSANFNYGPGKVKVKVRAEFDSGRAQPSLSADAKFCVDGLGCSGSGIKELRLKDSGAIRICVNTSVGKACQTL